MKRKKTTKCTSSQKRKKNRFRLFVVLLLLDVALIVGILLMLPGALSTTDKETGESKALLGVTGITVEGNTRYDEAAIIGVSDIDIGESVFSINERTVEKKIKKAFSYAESVDVQVSLNRQVTITITEAEELGAVYVAAPLNGDEDGTVEGHWMVVSNKGVGLMRLPLESERPFRRLYLKGAVALADKIGEPVLDQKSLNIATELVDAMRANGVTGVGEIDMSDRNNICLNWKNQITVALGSDTNLTYEIAVVKSAIPKVLSRHGETATGLLNLRQYADDSVESPVIVFTPSSILNAEPETIPPEDASSITTTASGITASTTARRTVR